MFANARVSTGIRCAPSQIQDLMDRWLVLSIDISSRDLEIRTNDMTSMLGIKVIVGPPLLSHRSFV